MKALNLPQALVFDLKEASAKQMAAMLKDIFTTVYLYSDPATLLEQCSKIKPKVIFINLGIEQRSKNLTLIEELSVLPDSPIFFGYMESYEPEIVAHAIEMGFHDIFTRPFDVDIISTKLVRFIKNDHNENREINYTSVRETIPCSINAKFRIKAVDENGIHLTGPHYISKGTRFFISGDLIQTIYEEHEVEFMVVKTSTDNNSDEFACYIEPTKSSEERSGALRRFLMGKMNA